MRRLRPFALPLGVGTDICRISRIYGILDGPRRERFVRRILAPEELARDGSRIAVDGTEGRNGGERRDPALWKMAVFMAGRFAAKEAAIKAHAPLRRLSWHDVTIERRPGTAPRLGSGPPVARIRAEDGDEDESALVSISHDGDYATAVCVAHLSAAGEKRDG